MKLTSIIIIVLGVWIESTAVSESSMASEKCPFESIEDFVSKYAVNHELQRKYTTFPLVHSKIVDGEQEPKVVTEMITKSKAEIPIMPGPKESKKLGLDKSSISKLRENRWEYKLWKEDTDFQLRFIVKKDACFSLIEYHNDSL